MHYLKLLTFHKYILFCRAQVTTIRIRDARSPHRCATNKRGFRFEIKHKGVEVPHDIIFHIVHGEISVFLRVRKTGGPNATPKTTTRTSEAAETRKASDDDVTNRCDNIAIFSLFRVPAKKSETPTRSGQLTTLLNITRTL